MSKCFFTKTNTAAILDRIVTSIPHRECLCIYSRKSRLYDPTLQWNSGIKWIEFNDYGKDSTDVVSDHLDDILVVIGLSNMIRPSNRCDIRFEYMYNFTKFREKFIIDEVPFLQEKWRVWYPYGVIAPAILLYPHSYAIESAYRNYEEGLLEDDPLEIPWIIERVIDYTEIDYRRYFNFDLRFEVHETTEGQKREYDKLKEKLFDTNTTILPIIRGLAQYAQSICPQRTIFIDTRKLYKLSEDTVIHMTDLKVDIYLAEEIERVIIETNQLTEGLYENLHRQERP